AQRITSGLIFGVTMSLQPIFASWSTCSGCNTVPAPISALSPYASTTAGMLFSHSGELSGISTASNPASITAPTWANASSGVIPRKIAIRGRLVCHCMSDAPYSCLKCRIAGHRRDVTPNGAKRLLIARRQRCTCDNRDDLPLRDEITHAGDFSANQQAGKKLAD